VVTTQSKNINCRKQRKHN